MTIAVLCCAWSLSWAHLFVTWAFRAPPSVGTLQARTLEWVAMSSSRESSQPRNQTQVSLIEGRFFTISATGEAQEYRMGSLSLLQGTFPTQELNWGLLLGRQTFTSWATREAWDYSQYYSILYLQFARGIDLRCPHFTHTHTHTQRVAEWDDGHVKQLDCCYHCITYTYVKTPHCTT